MESSTYLKPWILKAACNFATFDNLDHVVTFVHVLLVVALDFCDWKLRAAEQQLQ